MEGREANSNGTAIPKKSKSLDLKSLYKSKLTKETPHKSLKRVGSGSGDGDEKRNKRKKARKEVSLSSLENADGSSKKILDAEGHKRPSSGGQGLHELKLGVSKRLSGSSWLNRVSFSLDGDVCIPKRKRNFVGRKKSEVGQAPNLAAGQPSCKSGNVDQVPKLDSDDLSRGLESSKTEQKNEVKENRSSDSNSVLHVKGNEVHTSYSIVNSGDSSLIKSRRKNRKQKTLPSDRVRVAKEAEPLIDSCKVSADLHEEDEENLEENAARMLSSRFDPSCTGFSSSSKSSTLPSANGLAFLLSSSRNIVNRGSKTRSGSESASVDTASRVLRPRTQCKDKGSSRKRRHFYEIVSGDVDPYWVLNRRIKVFWPLDQIWYYGLVNDYDNDKKLHHIKYDDRDEEWINLQTERFKLLLLRSEVPGNARGKRALAKSRGSDQQSRSKSRKESQRREAITEDDSLSASCMDSEPIISWLARSSHRRKSSFFNGIKRQKISAGSLNTALSLLYDEPVKVKGHSANSSLRDVRNTPYSDSLSQDKLGNNCRMKSSMQSATCSKDGKQPIVYVRNRFRSRPSMSPHMPTEKPVITSAPCSVPFGPVVGGAVDVKDSSASRAEVEGPLRFMCNAGVSEVFWDMESAVFKFDLKFPLCLVLNDCFELENLWFVYSVLLLQYGTVMTKWPRVCLEMLFVDNVVGLRFLLFEGCLKMATAFLILVLRVFHQPAHQGNYIDLQLPVTSIGFKFFSLHVLKKPLVFAFYNFSKVNNSKWRVLDSKLKRHCLLSKQLHLSECTYDNIQALQNGSTGFSMSSINKLPLVKVKQKRSRPGINIMGVSKVYTQGDIHLSFGAGNRKLPPFVLSFAAAPTFFLSLHLKLLMEQSVAHRSFCDHAPINDQEDSGLVMDDFSINDDCFNRNSEVNPEKDMMTLSKGAAGDGWSGAELDQVTGPSTGCDQIISQNYQDIGLNGSATPISNGFERHGANHLPEWQSHHSGLELGPLPLIQKDEADDGSHSLGGDLSVQIPLVDQFDKTVDGYLHGAQDAPDFSWNMQRGLIRSPNPTAPRSSWHRNRNSSSSPGFQSHGLSNGKADSLYIDFGNGPKKPRTQVSYSVPFAGYEFSSRNRSHHQKGLPHKRIRKASEKKSSEVGRGSEKNFECLSCEANVLITLGDKGWREYGAHVVLEVFDHNEWKLSVKLLGITKYTYKAHQFLQPGSTNRYTHAMMWKGGKDWILEFPDRSQWALFKEMHEECYNRNIRAASVKNIPIPGVHLIEENDDSGVTFFRSCKYIQQIETDVDMALDPSHVLYDMDSEDEQWISNNQNFEKDSSGLNVISEEVFERTMDMFEKVAYVKKSDQFTPNEIEELMVNVGPLCVAKNIYDYWQWRRQKKGMALIRHFQPPLWEKYQQQLKEWEAALTKNNTSSDGVLDKVATLEKPPMFAFCLKPRGLELQNKVSKHRSQKRIPVSGHTNGILDQDGLQTFGRRSNGFAIGDDKFVYPGHSYDSLDDSPLPQTSPRVFSPRDADSMRYYSINNDGYYRNHNSKIQRSKSKKFETFKYNDLQMTASYSQRLSGSGKRNGVSRWNVGGCDLPGHRHYLQDGPQRHGIEQLDGSDLDEYRLRDASSAAQHARSVAKLKRERAQRLLNRADLAIHRAVAALTTAEAMKALEDSVDEASEAPII